MKKIFVIILYLFSFIYATAQSYASIKGVIRNPFREFIILQSTDDYWISMRQDTIRLSKSGNFTYNYPLSEQEIKHVFLEVSKKQAFPLWIAKNQSLNIKVIDSVSPPLFSGPLAKLQQFVAEEEELEQNIYNQYKNRNPLLEKDSFYGSDAYFVIHDSITSDKIAFVSNYFKNTQTRHDKAFIKQQINTLVYRDLYYKLSMELPQIEKFKPYQVQQRITGSKPYKFSDIVNFNNPSLLKNHSYQSFSNRFFSAVALKNLKQKQDSFSKEQYYKEIFQLINLYSENTTANALLKTIFLNDEVRSLKYDHAEETAVVKLQQYLNMLSQEKPVHQEVLLVEQNLNAILEEKLALKKGTLAPDLVLLDSLGNKKSLSDYKGKLLYVDVWASWCRPCIASIPFWNQLTQKFADREDLAFLIISIDDDFSIWTKALQRFKPQGVNLSSIGGFKESELTKKYNIRALPSNILIDKEGKIIDARAEGLKILI